MVALYPQGTPTPATVATPLAAAPVRMGAVARSIYEAQGITGLKQFYGRLYEDINFDLHNERGRLLLREIMDNDAVVGGVFNHIDTTLRGTRTYTRPADQSQEALRQQVFVQGCLDDLEHSWDDFMCEAVRGAAGFGWSYWEVQYKRRLGPAPLQPTPTQTDPDPYLPPSRYDDGAVGWWKMGLRSQESLWKWEFSPSQRLLGMTQLPAPDYRMRTIDYDRALLFRLRSYKESPEGASLLRNSVPFWKRKHQFEVLEGIGAERDLAGIPVFWGPPEMFSASASPKMIALYAKAQEMVRNLRNDEQAGIIMPLLYDPISHQKLYDLSLLSTGGSRQYDLNAVIARYNALIAMTMSADFLQLGHGQDSAATTGQVKVRSTLWLQTFRAMQNSFLDEINRRAIPMLIRANGWDTRYAPTLLCTDVKALNVQEIGVLLQTLSQAGLPVGQDRALYDYVLGEAAAPSDGAAAVYAAQIDAFQDAAQVKRTLHGSNLAQSVPPGQEPNGQRAQSGKRASRDDTRQDSRAAAEAAIHYLFTELAPHPQALSDDAWGSIERWLNQGQEAA